MKPLKVFLTSSGGGHLEQLQQLRDFRTEYTCVYLLPNTVPEPKDGIPALRFTKMKHDWTFYPSVLIVAAQQLRHYLFEKPDVVISTGASDTIPICAIAKFFGKKVIYIESFARMHELNKTGKFLYGRADLFIVQWPELAELYPKAVYGGWIY